MDLCFLLGDFLRFTLGWKTLPRPRNVWSKSEEEVFHSKMETSVANCEMLWETNLVYPERCGLFKNRIWSLHRCPKVSFFFLRVHLSHHYWAAAWMRLQRLVWCVPEFHPERKVFELDKNKQAVLDATGERVRLQNPRWRAILMQSTIDYLVCISNAQVEVIRSGQVEKIVRKSTVVGLSTAEEGLQTSQESVSLHEVR